MKSEVKFGERSVQITRLFDAPRPVVFGWWSEGAKLRQWSGCKEATRCEVLMDFRVGGGFTQKMHIAGKGEFAFTGTYDEIIVPEKIVYRAQFGPWTTRVVVEFQELGGRTRVALTHDGFPDEAFCKNIAQGTADGLEKLEALLAPAPEVRLP